MTDALQTALITIATQLADIDPAAAKNEVEAIDVKILATNDAIQAGEDRIARLDEEIRTRKALGPDQHAAAEALLAGENVLERAPGPELLSEERATVAAGITGLKNRRRDLIEDRARVADTIVRELSLALEPALDALRGEAADLVGRLLDVRASAAAIFRGMNSVEARNLVDALHRVQSLADELRLHGRTGAVDEGLGELLAGASALKAPPAPPKPSRAAERRAARSGFQEGPFRISTTL